MDTNIATALITAGAMIIVQIVISLKQQRTHDVKVDFILDEVKKDLSRLEEKQDKHNKLIERMAVVERDQKTIFRYIDELRGNTGG